MFCIVCTVFLYCFVYVSLFLFVLSVLVSGLLPPSDNSIAVSSSSSSNNNNNNNNYYYYYYVAAYLPHVLAVLSHPLWEQLPQRNYIEVGTVFVMVWDSSVVIATRCGVDSPGIESRWGATFSVPVQTGPIQPPI
jgi:hypothetical protein